MTCPTEEQMEIIHAGRSNELVRKTRSVPQAGVDDGAVGWDGRTLHGCEQCGLQGSMLSLQVDERDGLRGEELRYLRIVS